MTMSVARALRDAIEPFHVLAYFAPEHRAPYLERGLHPWAAYFAQRAAPMGRVEASVVSAVFYVFSPRLVEKSIPSVWDVVAPATAVDWRLAATKTALERVLGPVDAAALEEAIGLAARAVSGAELAGRPLAAAHAELPPQDDPLVELWRLTAVLREYRGDGHVAALVSAGIGPVEALLLSEGFADYPPGSARRLRGWTEEEWQEGMERCIRKGWIDADGNRTEAGTSLRATVEDHTDRSMAGPLTSLGEEGAERLIALMEPLSRRVLESGEVGWR